MRYVTFFTLFFLFILFDGSFSQNPEWIVYNTLNTSLPDNHITGIEIDKSGNKWIGTYGGWLVKFDNSNWTVYDTLRSGLSDDWIRALAMDESNNLWVGKEGCI